MPGRKYLYATVQSTKRAAVFAVRVQDELLTAAEAAELTESMREWVQRKGLSVSDIVVVQGAGKETLALFGEPHSVRLVREAMFHASVRWNALSLD